MRYIVDNYNQRIDARMGDQTRFQRWDAGLRIVPDVISVRVQAKQHEVIELDEVEVAPIETEPEPEMAEVFDYEQLREDYGW